MNSLFAHHTVLRTQRSQKSILPFLLNPLMQFPMFQCLVTFAAIIGVIFLWTMIVHVQQLRAKTN